MNNKIEKNLLKAIMLSFIFTMSAIVLTISLFYYINTKESFDRQMVLYENEFYEKVKANLKTKAMMVKDILNYNITNSNLSKEEQREYAIKLFSTFTFEQNRSNYIFIYEVLNYEGGDDFAIMMVNPNRPDLFGRLISTNDTDVNGKRFREIFLKDINEKKESFVTYSYKKPDADGFIEKLSYFELFPEFDWIISVGIYIDDVQEAINIKRKGLEEEIKKQIFQNIILFVLALLIAILISTAISNEIYKILKNYRKQVDENEKELKILNKSLEEMMLNIAHQWRQPLAELSSILMVIKLKYDTNKLDAITMEQKGREANMVLEYMSNTIDDFRGFFSSNKEKENFILLELISSVISINKNVFNLNEIIVDVNIDKNIKIYNILNEYQQVVLNILKNAKDVLLEKNIKNPQIKIYADDNENSTILYIEDNAGGILISPINKIFEAYFSTKNDKNGVGIGLYMSKIIVEKSLKGKILVENSSLGAKFSIVIFKDKI
ncbi:Methyl-accepting chemotaxis protein 4 [Aliarcobacter thereius]|uniref:histidine kinase n=1 Tax=Aliarcobacter thereius TaxID=544718 RepID=A0A1C0B777_9BACT|nr:cache domain-containing protein [Aliarcobacter thereius]OCL99456.1 Methyl-accepting chemotaxis protein 4 [Aliarcobacter thereius]